MAKSQPLPAPAGELRIEMLSQGLSRQVNWVFTLSHQQAIGSVSLEGCKCLKHLHLCGCCWLSRALAGDRPSKETQLGGKAPVVCVCMPATTVCIKVGHGLLLLSHLIILGFSSFSNETCTIGVPSSLSEPGRS